MIAGSVHNHPHPPRRNNGNNPKDRPHVKNQHNSHTMEGREEAAPRRLLPPQRREEQMQTGKAAPKQNIKIKNKTTSGFEWFHPSLLSVFLFCPG